MQQNVRRIPTGIDGFTGIRANSGNAVHHIRDVRQDLL